MNANESTQVPPMEGKTPLSMQKPGESHNGDASPRSGIRLGSIHSDAKSDIQVVEFLLGEEHFAIDLFEVREVVEYTRITRLPDSPVYIKGIIDLRGEITTIIDLKHQLHIHEQSTVEESSSRIIVLDDKITKSKIGIMVDDVLSVSTFSTTDVDTIGSSINRDRNNIIGIIRKKVRIKEKDVNELIIWIDIQRLLQDVDKEIHEEGYGQGTE